MICAIGDDWNRWMHPASWPWFAYVWLGFFVISNIPRLWRWYRKHNAQSWPTAQGRIELVTIGEQRKFLGLTVSDGRTIPLEISYSYVAGGQNYRGVWRRDFGVLEDAENFGQSIEQQPIAVAYNPDKPSIGVLSDEAVDELASKRQSPNRRPTRTEDVPSWIKPLLWPFLILSAIGLILSLWVHVGALNGRKVAPEPMFWMLHVGIFFVWFPAVIVGNRLARRGNRKDYWNAVFNETPALKYIVYAFGGYAILNFLIFTSQAPGKDGNGPATAMMWRGFSGHWMLFYAAALAILYAAVQPQSELRTTPPK